jgi:subfamily B ATP-binding cassette protein MsbA
MDAPQESIRFHDVDFEYEPGRPVLRGIDFEARPGEVVALVGPSGAGKSTLVDLLPRFIDPTGGRITMDGRDLRDIPLGSLRSLFGVVSQETVIFHDTVRANISYGEERDEDDIWAAIRAANAEEFIRDLPNGVDTLLGDRGVRLSGGQRQRVGIARAILRDPPLLILDEATSSLDTESEQLIQAALDRLLRGRTVFVIAHRLSTISGADRILALEDGRLVESGTHDELHAAGGLYRRLSDLQFASPAPPVDEPDPT